MSIWASESNRRAVDSSGNKIKGMVDVYADTTTDSNGQFQVDLSAFNLSEVLDATAVIVGQALGAADNITDKLSATVIQVSNTLVKGATIKPTTINSSIGSGGDTAVRGGSGDNVKVKITGRR